MCNRALATQSVLTTSCFRNPEKREATDVNSCYAMKSKEFDAPHSSLADRLCDLCEPFLVCLCIRQFSMWQRQNNAERRKEEE